MRTVSTFILLLCISCVAIAQDSYRVMLNAVVLVEKDVDDSIPSVSLPSKSVSTLRIVYRAADYSHTKLMRRQFILFSASGEELATYQMHANEGVAEMKLNPSLLKKKHAEILLYTVSIPSDPEIAKRLKPRRVLLAKICWA